MARGPNRAPVWEGGWGVSEGRMRCGETRWGKGGRGT